MRDAVVVGALFDVGAVTAVEDLDAGTLEDGDGPEDGFVVSRFVTLKDLLV